MNQKFYNLFFKTFISELCFMSPLYLFKKHNISNIYSEVSVNILNFLNIGLQEVRLCVPVINIMTFFCSSFMCSSN